MTQPTDATKLPEHIRYDGGPLGGYRIRTGPHSSCWNGLPSNATADDLRTVANFMDAQAGRTAAPVVTEETLRKWSDDITNVLHRYNSTRIAAGAAWAFHNYAEPTIERVVAEMRTAALGKLPSPVAQYKFTFPQEWHAHAAELERGCNVGAGIPACIWTQADQGGGLWEPGCSDHAFEFNDGGPLENHFEHCPYCAAKIAEEPWTDDEEPAKQPRDATSGEAV